MNVALDDPVRSIESAEQEFQTALESVSACLGLEWDVRHQKNGRVNWCQFTHKEAKLPAQGWKIHVSASASEAVECCRRVLPWLVQRKTTVKIAGDLASLVVLNSGEAGETQTGKFLTVYPANSADARALALELDRRWPHTRGPAVPSDLAVRREGAVFLRYGALDRPGIYDRFGKLSSSLRDPTGALIEDERSMDGRQPEWAAPPLEGLVPALSDIEGPLGSGDDLYLPLQILAAVRGAKVFLGLSLSDASEVLIKLRRRGVGAGLEGEADERLRAEAIMLSLLERKPGLAPRLLGFFPGTEYSVLVTEYVAGELLSDLPREGQISHLGSLARAVARLHKAGFAHRDIKLSNAIVRKGRVRLIDFELAAQIGSSHHATAGTRGHMPPERSPQVAAADDVYALGACIAHAHLGFDPAGLPEGGGRLIGLLALCRSKSVSHVVRKLLRPEAHLRPAASAVAGMLEACAYDDARENSYPSLVSPSWCLRAAVESAGATRSFRYASGSGFLWETRQYDGVSSSEGLNTGSAGIALGLLSIDHACGSTQFKEDIAGPLAVLSADKPYENAHGLFTGNAGVALALAVAAKRYAVRNWMEGARTRLAHASGIEEESDLFSGAAGILWSACLIGDVLDDKAVLELVSHLGDRLLSCAKMRDGVTIWPLGGPEKVPLTGAAHGSAGIALALAAWGRRVQRVDAIEFALDVFERLYTNGRVPGGEALRRTVTESPEVAPVLSWCHGIAGYLWCMLEAFGDHERLRSAIDWCVRTCANERISASPVYCHGLAGELELWRMLSRCHRWRDLARQRADRAASALRLSLVRRNGVWMWGAEDPQTITPDLWVGFLGPATSLALHARGIHNSILSSCWLSSCALERQ